MKRVGYIGLGIMGAPMAANLLKAGFQVTVWNRTASRADPLVKLGAKTAASPAEVAAQVEAVCVNVTDTPDVQQVIFGPRGIVEGNPGNTAGMVILDHSTISAAATRDFARRLEQYEIEFLDAPVSGGQVGAIAGSLAVMVGGKSEVFTRCLPILQAMGKTITHIGPVGAGQVCKACNQIGVVASLLGACEAMALAAREGIDVNKMIQVLGGGAADSWQLRVLGPKIMSGDLKPAFMIDLLNKDLAIVQEAARNLKLSLPVTALAVDLFLAAAANGMGRDGTQAVSRIYENLGAFSFRPE